MEHQQPPSTAPTLPLERGRVYRLPDNREVVAWSSAGERSRWDETGERFPWQLYLLHEEWHGPVGTPASFLVHQQGALFQRDPADGWRPDLTTWHASDLRPSEGPVTRIVADAEPGAYVEYTLNTTITKLLAQLRAAQEQAAAAGNPRRARAYSWAIDRANLVRVRLDRIAQGEFDPTQPTQPTQPTEEPTR